MINKILMTADAVGGVWTYALELCRSLGRDRVTVALATMGVPLSTTQRSEVEALENVILFESALRLEWMQDPWADTAAAGKWLLNIRDQFQPDIVHLNGYVHGALHWDVPVIVAGHSCVYSWWQAVHGTTPPAEWARYRNEVACGLQSADEVVAPSQHMLQSLRNFYGPLSAAAVIPNGRTGDVFRATAKLPMILSAGRLWDPAKNVSSLVHIADQLEWPVYLAGQDKGPNELPSSHEIRDRSPVRHLGFLNSEQLAHWMGRASIFALPARYEPFGYTVLEAALAGCALVLGDIPSLRENWTDAAVFVDPGNEEEIKQAISAVISDPQYRLYLATRAKVRGAEFTADKMARKYLDLYKTLCGSFSSTTH